jgi:hypothetical protein
MRNIDISATTNHKVPKVRQEVMLWLARVFSKATTTAKRTPITKVVKQLGPYFLAVSTLCGYCSPCINALRV